MGRERLMSDDTERGQQQRVRLDKWLWAARFYKTRSLAATAVEAGKVEVNGERPKRSKLIKAGDAVSVRKGPFEHQLTVKALSERRGPPAQAQLLYQESEESLRAREELAALMALDRATALPPVPRAKGRPTKRDRRQLSRFKGDL